MYWLDNNTGIPTAPTIPPVASATKRYFTNGGAGVPPSVPEDFWFNMMTEELLGVLDMAGIAPEKDDLGQLAKAIQSIAFSAYPVGAPIPWPTAVPPPGFLVMAGQSFSQLTYPKLALAYPSLVIPDMRAEFIRGWDNGRGVDAGRAIGTFQGDAIRNIAGSFIAADNNSNVGALSSSTGAFTLTSDSGRVPSWFTGSSVGTRFLAATFNASNVVPTANENRPRNIPFLYIVRAI